MTERLSRLFTEFLESEQASGIILILCTVLSILAANSAIGGMVADLWHTRVGLQFGQTDMRMSIEHWINDGLMVIFFLLIGLEIERELYVGELSDYKKAALPIIAAIGGMTVPALLHYSFNAGTNTQAGIGIPVATDIAFALGVLSLLGSRVPVALKIFLAAFAIVDDLGAIIVIAIFYTSDLSLVYLFSALAVYAGLILLNRAGVRRLTFYLLPGVLLWFLMLQSGVHATIVGVLLAFAIPFAGGKDDSPSYRLQHFLHKPVAFLIMPLFAIANTGVIFADGWMDSLATVNSAGIFAGLYLGKPLGIFLFCAIAVALGLARLPEDVRWRHIIGTGFLGGIGFTMSIFITLLAFDSPELIQSSKITILFSSFIAAVTGYLILSRSNTSSRLNPAEQ